MFDLEIMYLSIPALLMILITCVIYKIKKDKKNKEDEKR